MWPLAVGFLAILAAAVSRLIEGRFYWLNVSTAAIGVLNLALWVYRLTLS